MSKQYRLKESVEKYFTLHNKNVENLEWWEKQNVTIEALEEVESKIDVFILGSYVAFEQQKNQTALCKKSGWTEQERSDIEEFLNVFGSMGKLKKMIYGYTDYIADRFRNKELAFQTWEQWLNENNK